MRGLCSETTEGEFGNRIRPEPVTSNNKHGNSRIVPRIGKCKRTGDGVQPRSM